MKEAGTGDTLSGENASLPEGFIPLSSEQRELWLAGRTSLVGEVDIRSVFFVRARLCPELLRSSLQLILKQFPLLRAVLHLKQKEPCFELDAVEALEFEVHDFSEGRSEEDAQEQALSWAKAYFEKPLGSQAGRFALLYTGPQECLYLTKVSHLVMDGVGLSYHAELVAQAYQALQRGEMPAWGEPCRATALLEEDERHRASPRMEQDIEWWKAHLVNAPERRIFRALPGRPDLLGNSRHQKIFLPLEVSRQIRTYLKAHGQTPACFFTALHALIVSFMCNERTVVIQTPIAFGERKVFARRQGSQISLPPVIVDLTRHSQFAGLLEDVSTQSKHLFRHIRTPYQIAIRQLGQRNFENLGDTYVNYVPHCPTGNEAFPIRSVEQWHSAKEEVLLGLMILEEGHEGPFSVNVRTSINHLNEVDADRYVKRMVLLSEQLVKTDELASLRYLLDEEVRELAEWRYGAKRDYSTGTIHGLFDQVAERHPRRPAVQDEEGRTLSYSELKTRSLGYASWLARRGVGKGAVVAVHAHRSLELPAVILGIMRVGGVYLPLDPKSPVDRLEHIIRDAKAVLTIDAGDPALSESAAEITPADTAAGDGAYLIYTSGSTGRPKGVLVPHGGFLNMIQGQIEIFGIRAEDRILQFASPAFDASLSEIFMALLAGASLYPVSDRYRNEPWELRDYLDRNGVTAATFPPSYLHLFERQPFRSLRILITAGEPPVTEDALHYAGQLAYFNAYGPTEACVCSAIKRVLPGEAVPISVGRVIPNGVALIFDAGKRELPAGFTGELHIGGSSLALGYYGNPALTEAKFVVLPSGERVYATGDLALWSRTGEILLQGRTDDQVKIRGNRVEPGEVAFLLERCSAVSQAFVVVTKDSRDAPTLSAFLVLSPGANLESVIAWSVDNLPGYMIPSRWQPVTAMPVTVTGKIDRDALRSLLDSPSTESSLRSWTGDPELLRLAGLALGRKYDPFADFFAQGGDSLSAIRFLHELCSHYQVEIPFRRFSQCGSLAEVETLLGQTRSSISAPALDEVPLSRAQFQLWAYQQANEGTCDYNMPLLLELSGARARDFCEALIAAVNDQPLLSCTIAGPVDAPFFKPGDNLRLSLPIEEMDSDPEAEHHFDRLIHSPFDLVNEPPIRLAGVRIGERLQILILLHHIAGDGETLNLLLKNAQLRLKGAKPEGGVLEAQVGFCAREHTYLESGDYRQDKAYWETMLKEPAPYLNGAARRRGGMARLPVDAHLVAALERLSKNAGASFITTLAALVGAFLCRRFDRSELLVGIPVGLRETQDEFRSAGFYVNTVALRLSPPTNESPVQLARQAATVFREALTHSRYGSTRPLADVLVTFSPLANIEEDGLCVRAVPVQLRGSKLTAGFTLETGCSPCLVLEHDANFLTEATLLLKELSEYLADACKLTRQRNAAEILFDAWTEILGEKPSPGSDFLLSGGDSIKAIQITGILHRSGIRALVSADFLRHPSYRDLSKMVGIGTSAAVPISSEATLKPGMKVPLLPLQASLCQRPVEQWKTFFMLHAMELASEHSEESLEAWLQSLPSRHEALRLRFTETASYVLERPFVPALERLKVAAEVCEERLLEEVVTGLSGKIDPLQGQCLAAALVTQQDRRLLVLLAHHLVVDALSLEILRQDLARFCADESPGPELPGIVSRTLEIERLLQEGSFPSVESSRRWSALLQTPTGVLNALKKGQDDRAGDRVCEVRTISDRFGQRGEPLVELLSGLSMALHTGGQRDAVFALLESHGRDGVVSDRDYSRSIGWFTAVCPLPLMPSDSVEEARGWLRPLIRDSFGAQSGIEYSYLRRAEPSSFACNPQISLNYFGDLMVRSGKGPVPLLSSAMPGKVKGLVHPEHRMETALDLVAFRDEAGCLQLGAYYSPRVLPSDWVAGLLDSWVAALSSQRPGFPGLSDSLLTELAEKSSCLLEDIESVQQPDPSHEPMLYQHLSSKNSIYTQQIEFHFEGEINEYQLMKAWGEVVNRHESLRSLFPMPHPGEFYRLVLRDARVSSEHHDLSRLPTQLAERKVNDMLKAERNRGFDLAGGPLLRTQCFRLAPTRLLFSWCFHHLLMDGWCIGILLNELFAVLAAAGKSGEVSSLKLPKVPALSDYRAWRSRFDEVVAKQYWSSLLKGYQPSHPFSRQAYVALTGGGDPQTHELTLGARLAEQLRAVASRHGVTLPILVQSLWAILVSSREGSKRDQVFGLVSSGRPEAVEGMESMVGLFIQTVPVRVRWTPERTLSELLGSLKEQGLAQLTYGYLPLPAIGHELFDHLLVFENYPQELRLGDGALRLTRVHGYEKIPYPLGLSVVPEGKGLLFRFLHDPAYLNKEDVTGLAEGLHALLQRVVSLPSPLCGELEAAVSLPGEDGSQSTRTMEFLSQSSVEARTVNASPSVSDLSLNEVEKVVSGIYQTILACGVPSPEAEFLQLGGHSLLAMRVMAQVSRRFSVRLDVDDILKRGSVRQLARLIREASRPADHIEPRTLPEIFPLSPSQTRIWFLQRLHEDSRTYLIPFAARISGVMEPGALQKALTLVEQRHDALRLRVSDTEPLQKLMPEPGLKLKCLETPFSPQEALRTEMVFGFDKPLVEASLHRERDGSHILFLCAHHIVFDGWSAGIFVSELNQAYAAVLGATTPGWSPLEIGYAHYVLWQGGRDYPGLQAACQMLQPLPEPLRLPVDHQRPALQRLEGTSYVFTLSDAQGAGLRTLADKCGSSLFPVLLSLCKTLLYRVTGQNDIIVGCPAANREVEQTQQLIGLFVNTLAVRSTLDPDKSFMAQVEAVKAAFGTALANQDCPLEVLLDHLKVERVPSRNPLFDVFVALESAEWNDFGQEPLHLEPVNLPHDRSKFDLSFYFKERREGSFEVHIEYATALFEQESIQRLANRLSSLLEAVLRNPETSLRALNVFSTEERRLVDSFNATEEALPVLADSDSCFRAQCKRAPQSVALLDQTGRALAYEEFNGLVDKLAAWLTENKVGEGRPVGVCYERSVDLMVAIFAVLRVGAIYVPLSPSLPSARIRAILGDLPDCVILSSKAQAGMLSDVQSPVLVPDIAGLPSCEAHKASLSADALAYVIFTSGSTGTPKGVLTEHRSLQNRLWWMQARFPIGLDDVILQKTTISFDVSLWELLWWSWTGAALALLEPEAEKDPGKIVEAIHRHKVTVIHFVPSMLRAFIEHLETFRDECQKLVSLRYVFASGEALPSELVRRFQGLIKAELHNLYGPTEAAIDVTWYPCLNTPGDVIPIGRPVSNTQIRILDVHLGEVPVGVVGELYIGGVQVARGYANRKDLTAERFLPDPFIPGQRLYKTGDLARWLPDGNIEYLGRNDDQVKVRGFRIELAEVESALMRCPGVSQAVVRVRRVGGYDSLEAFLLPQEGAELSSADIQAELSRILPAYMCPSVMHLVDEIPLGASGKADRAKLRGRLLGSEQESETQELTAIQKQIRDAWVQAMPEADALDCRRGFFESGGNSLLLVKLHNILDARWPGVFSIATLFAESTIAAQAALLEKAGELVPVRDGRTSPAEQAVAIIGLALRVGDYSDTESFWDDLVSAADKTIEMPEARRTETRQLLEAVGLDYDEARLRKASYLSDISSFDHRRFGLTPGDASLIEPQQRLFMEVALQALDDAGYGGAALQGRKVGVFAGASPYRLFQDALTRAFPEQRERSYLLNVPSNVVARISYLKDWSGPAAMVDTACSSSLTALHQACENLRRGDCCVALVGAANVIPLPLKSEQTFTIESSTGQTRSFDASADGVGAGEGAAVFVLKRLDQALADGDNIRATIVGTAINQDGKSSSMAAPNPLAQAEVISLAASQASLSLGELAFFEAHGTATVLGDPIEIEGITRAFSHGSTELGQQQDKAWISSVKGNLGHLDAAAGAIGLAKAVLCLEKGYVPPQPHFERPNPHIDFEKAPVRVPTALAPLASERRPWAGGVSSFGLSGVNAHAILREAPLRTFGADDGSWFCIPLSAPSREGLLSYARALLETLVEHPEWPVHAIAGTLTDGREQLEARAALVVSSRAELLELLGQELPSTQLKKLRSTSVAAGVRLTKSQAETLAEAFLSGTRIDWPKERVLQRVSLPPTPFERKTLWPRFKTRFVGAPTKTPSGVLCELHIGRPDYWPVAEHRLNAAPTLVGMAALDLLADAMGSADRIIEDLSWLKPVAPGKQGRALLLMREEAGHTRIELQQCQNDCWSTALTAKFGPSDIQDRRRVAVSALISSLQAFEGGGEQPAIQISRRWHCRQGLWVSDHNDTLLAQLRLPSEYREDLVQFKWHPAMMDVAVSTALHGTVGFVPARCASVRLISPLTPEAYSHVQIRSRTETSITADCDILDSEGQVLVEMKGLLFISLIKQDKPPLHRQQPEPILLELPWHKVVPTGAANAVPAPFILLADENHSLFPELAPLALSHRRVPDTDETRQALLQEISDKGASHLVLLTSASCSHWTLVSLLRDVSRISRRTPCHVTAIGRGGLAKHHAASEDALLSGVMLSLPQEEPSLSCEYYELESRSSQALATLVGSIGRFKGTLRIASEGALLAQALSPLPPAAVRPLELAGCVVISGGLGGMGLTLARHLTENTKTRVVLLHRSPAREQPPFPAYLCDVNDAARVKEVLELIRQTHGPIRGIVHAAGVAGEGLLAAKEQSQYERVLAPKVIGTWNLHEATLGDALEFFLLASSRTSLTGGPGQCDYAAANAYLNAFAHYRRSLGLPALTLCWNAWSEVGMAARYGTDNAGFSLAPAQAWSVVQRALSSEKTLLAVAMTGEDLSHFASASPKQTKGAKDEVHLSGSGPRLSEKQLLGLIAEVMGYDRPLNRQDDFYDMGGDSITATQVVNKLNEVLGSSIGVMDLLDKSEMGDFVDYVLNDAQERKEQAGGQLQPAPLMEKYPVGREQRSILYAQLLSGNPTGFNLPVFLKLPTEVDKARLQWAISELIKRHEVLRTSFCDFDAEQPNMIIHPAKDFDLGTLHLESLEQKDGLITPFDIKSGELFRAKLLMVPGASPILFLDIHHALADGRTMSLLNTELHSLYYGKSLPPLLIQQKDIAWHQHAHPNAEDKAYWLEQFAGELPLLDLPSDLSRPPAHTSRGATHEFELPASLVQGIMTLANRNGVTPFIITLTAWRILIHRSARSEDFVIAITLDSREDHQGTAGMLAALLPLRLRQTGGRSVSELLADGKRLSAEARRHKNYILNDLLTDLHPPIHRERNLLSEVLISYMNFEIGDNLDAVFETLPFNNSSSKADISISVSDVGGRILFFLEYYADLFTPRNMQDMAEDLETILQRMVSDDTGKELAFAPRTHEAKGTLERQLDAGLSDRVNAFAKSYERKPEDVFLVTLAALLYRLLSRGRIPISLGTEKTVWFQIDEETELAQLFFQLDQARKDGFPEPAVQQTAQHSSESGLRMPESFTFVSAQAQGEEPVAGSQSDFVCRIDKNQHGYHIQFVFDQKILRSDTAENWLGYYLSFLEDITGSART